MIDQVDFLVIGSGIAGLTFALKAQESGSIAVATKKDLPESNTAYAQGGIAASIGEDDSWQLHEQDTLVAGAGICDPVVVRMVTQEGPRLVRWLIDLGAEFDQSGSTEGLPQILLGREGGHSRDRIIHSADHTGREIERALVSATHACDRISILEYCSAVDLIMVDGACVGAWLFESRSKRLHPVLARATVLACGGCGRVYRYTTNPPIATGDGIAIARRAGADVANMEFIQFHPTALAHPSARSFLISERARGDGATLHNSTGERFMVGIHPLAELAPRDIVSRAIAKEMKRTGESCVFLDMTKIGSDKIRRDYPGIYERCLSIGLDITQEKIPVAPAAHYLCGGVWTDHDAATSIPRLFAAGEVAYTGLHGANRLASNSLLEALVFGERAAQQAANQPAMDVGKVPEPNIFSVRDADAVRDVVQQLMWDEVGIVRHTAGLRDAKTRLSEIALAQEPLEISGFEAANLVTTAEAIVECALLRTESRGTHFNEDFPLPDDEHWQRPTILSASR